MKNELPTCFFEKALTINCKSTWPGLIKIHQTANLHCLYLQYLVAPHIHGQVHHTAAVHLDH